MKDQQDEPFMTGDQFCRWLDAMFQSNKAKTNVEISRLLGRKPNRISIYKTKGTDRTVALACAALLKGVRPYGEME